MTFFVFCALAAILFVFLTGLCVQLIRIEKQLTRITAYAETQVSRMLSRLE